MKFKDLSKEQQNFLIDNIDNWIEEAAQVEGICYENIEFPTLHEYTDFFDNYDEEYIIKDGYPKSIHDEYHNEFRIEFDSSGKVILNVYEYDCNKYDEDYF